MLKLEPTEFVGVVITTGVDAPITEPGVCSGGLLLPVEAGVGEASTLVTVGIGTVDLDVDEASGTGTKAVNVLENVKADPAEFVSVKTKTELAVVTEELGPVVEVVPEVSTEGPADSVFMGLTDSPADVGLGTSRVTDV